MKGLFRGRILIESLVLDGIDLKIQRRPDSTLWINGVEFETLLASATGDRAAREGSAAGAWQVGIDYLEVRASQAVLEDVNGGLMELDLRRLSLANFRSWEPESPGNFELNGAINGIDMNWSGEAHPFADPLVASASGVIAGVTVDRIRRFTGPLGFSRRQGELGTRMEVQFSVDSMKSWRLGTKGKLTLESVELATDDGLNAAMVSTTVDLDTEATFSPEQGFTLSGFIGGEAKGFGLSDGPRDAIGVEGASFALSEFAVTRFGSFSVALPTADSAGDTRIPSLARQLVNWIEAIALEFVNGDLDGNITGMLAANGIQMKAAGLAGSMAVDGKIDTWRSDFENLEAGRTGDVHTVSGALSTKVEDIAVEMGFPDRTASISLDELALRIPQLAGSWDVGSVTTTFVGSLNASGLSTGMETKEDGATREMKVGSITLEVPEFSGDTTPDQTTGSGRLTAILSNLEGVSTAEGAAGTMTSKSMQLRLSSLSVVAGADRNVTRLAGDLDATEIQIAGPSTDDGMNMSAGNSRIAFDPIVLVRESDNTSLDSHIDGRLSNLQAEIPTFAGIRIAPQGLLDLKRQPVHATAHVRNAGRQPDPNPGGNRDHRASSAATTRASARASTSAPTMIRWPVTVTISMRPTAAAAPSGASSSGTISAGAKPITSSRPRRNALRQENNNEGEMSWRHAVADTCR